MMSQQNWGDILDNIPPNAIEAVVTSQFVKPLLEAIGFSSQEQFPSFATGRGAEKADLAARKNIGSNNFLFSPINPYLLVEVKGRATDTKASINLS
jgi:chromosome partitioning protein